MNILDATTLSAVITVLTVKVRDARTRSVYDDDDNDDGNDDDKKTAIINTPWYLSVSIYTRIYSNVS